MTTSHDYIQSVSKKDESGGRAAVVAAVSQWERQGIGWNMEFITRLLIGLKPESISQVFIVTFLSARMHCP